MNIYKKLFILMQLSEMHSQTGRVNASFQEKVLRTSFWAGFTV